LYLLVPFTVPDFTMFREQLTDPEPQALGIVSTRLSDQQNAPVGDRRQTSLLAALHPSQFSRQVLLCKLANHYNGGAIVQIEPMAL
jgi:hypothetical protein